jgi:hypothetical protein
VTGYWHRFGQNYPQIRTVIVILPLVILLIAANDQRQNAERRHTNQQFQRALILTDHKFQQALRITTQQFSYAQNTSVCGFRKIANAGIERSRKILKDPTASRASRVAAQNTITQGEEFLATQVTVPTDFDCATLPETPPKATP